MKHCCRCQISKPPSEFYKNSARKDGLQTRCKDCCKKDNDAYRSAHPERTRAYVNACAAKFREKRREAARRRYYADIEKHRARGRKTALAWQAKNPGRAAERARRWEAARIKAMPAWAEPELLELIYAEAAHRRLEVDHIIPLRGRNVCGLHVHYNLQLLSRSENARKGNRLDERFREAA